MADFSEASLEELCLEQLAGLGWSVAPAPLLAPGPDSERDSYADAILLRRLRAAVQRLNPSLPDVAVDEVVRTVGRAESQVLLSENWRVHRLLTQGVPVEFRTADGRMAHERAWLIDWENPLRNDFVATSQFTVSQDRRSRRADIVLFVNGLALALYELKAPSSEAASLKRAFNQIRTYADDVPALFLANAVCVVSDGLQARVGSFSARWEHFAPWKALDSAAPAPPGAPQIETLTLGVFEKDRFLDLVRNFVSFSEEGGQLVKRIAKYHQFWAVNTAVSRTVHASTVGDGRAGVVWHTQGSGKSLEMLFYAAKIMRSVPMQNPTVVLLTDRNDLDDQLYDEVFSTSRLLPEAPIQATSRESLRKLLTRRSGGIVFSTLQKFGLSADERNAGKSFPELSNRSNVVVVADEAHRSQYDFIDGLARNLRDALPNATFIGFTGTPIEAADKNTRQVFGDYIDVYDLTQAVADGATVPVLYEGRLAKVELPAEALQQIDDSFEAATEGTEDEARARLKSRWARLEAIVGSDQRVRELAADILNHWDERFGVLTGKAMIVCLSRKICVSLYDELSKLRPDWHSEDDARGRMKVVITGSAADEPALQPHIRSREALRDLKRRAKDPTDDLELIIVRDMWLTGFDSPSVHTMYIDKPMRGAALMQAIARVNRTFKDKPSGLIVDYIGIADDLREALLDYSQRDREHADVGQTVEARAVPMALEKHEVVDAMLHGYDWRAQLQQGTDQGYLRAISETANFLLGREELKSRFLTETRALISYFTMSVPNARVMAIRQDVSFFQAVRSALTKIQQSRVSEQDNGLELDTAIKQIVSDAVASAGIVDIYTEVGLSKPDLSLIDDEFIERLYQNPRPNLQIEMLRRLLDDEIREVGSKNLTLDRRFSEMLQESLTAYRNRSIDAAQVIAELVDLAKHLQAEAKRGGTLQMTDAEVAFYDAVRANDSAVLELGDDVLQALARELVRRVKANASVDWNAKESVRAKLRSTVKRLLIRYRYPPDRHEETVDLVMAQAELLATHEGVI